MRNIENNEQLDFQQFNILLYRMLAIAHLALIIKCCLRRTFEVPVYKYCLVQLYDFIFEHRKPKFSFSLFRGAQVLRKESLHYEFFSIRSFVII